MSRLTTPAFRRNRAAIRHLYFRCVAGFGLVAFLLNGPAFGNKGPDASQKFASIKNQLRFEENRGQFASAIRFDARTSRYSLSLTDQEARFRFKNQDGSSASVVRMQFPGAQMAAAPRGTTRLAGVSHYMKGNDRNHWTLDVPAYSEVVYSEVYRGVDLVFHSADGASPEYDFVVHPGARPEAIRLRFEGQASMQILDDGSLRLRSAGGDLLHHAPTVYQVWDGRRHAVEARFVQTADQQIAFRLGAYNHARDLIIDPVISYSTYLGGSGADLAKAIAVGTDGSIYVAGNTNSADFPTAAPLQGEFHEGLYDCFVSRFSPDGQTLIFSTYLGGSESEEVNGIAVDREGNVWVGGLTMSTDYPMAQALQSTFGGAADATLTKLSADGSKILFSTYLGGSGSDQANRIAIDPAGNAYLVGQTQSTEDFPTANAFQKSHGGGVVDAFVAKVSANGQQLIYSTFLGGDGDEYGLGIAADGGGNAYVTGGTTATNFPVAQPFQPTLSGGSDAFITKFAADGKTLVYSSYLGGMYDDYAFGIAVDRHGAAYVGGTTPSPDFPVVNAYQRRLKGVDAFVTKVAHDGASLSYSTFFGGSGPDEARSIAVDNAGSATIVGATRSPNLPTVRAVQSTIGGLQDAFIARFGPAGRVLTLASFLGGSGDDDGLDVVADERGSLYVSGATNSPDYPTANPLQPNYSGYFYDGFVTKIIAESASGEAGAVSAPVVVR